MISAASRLQGVEQLVDMGQLKDLADRLSAAGKYYALYCSPSAAAQRLQLYFKYGSKRDRGWS